MTTYTPESIARDLFNKDPKPAKSCQLLLDDASNDTIFEVLLTILFEGLDIIAQDLKTFDISLLSSDIIEELNPWFHSIGFKLYAIELGQDEVPDNHYCSVKINNDPYDMYFELKNITKNYHFTLNGLYEPVTKLDEIFAIYKRTNNTVNKSDKTDKVFMMYFNFY